MKLHLECPVRHALPVTEEVNGLIEYGVKVHLGASIYPLSLQTSSHKRHAVTNVRQHWPYKYWLHSAACKQPNDYFRGNSHVPGGTPRHENQMYRATVGSASTVA